MNPPQAEQLITIIKQAQLLKQQGSTEDSDPEYKRLLTMLRWYNQQSKGALQDKHLDTLKLQIQAFRLLSTNKMVPQSLLAQLDLPPVASQLAQIAPGVLPTLIDPQQLSQNRTQYMRNRVEYRIAELTAMESHSIQQTIELKALRLLPLQKQLRDSIMHSAKESSILRTCVDRSAYRQQKKQSLREARTTEKQERLLRNEKDLKERQKHIDYMNSIMAHGRDFMQCHRANTAKMAKWGQSVARFHQNAQKEEERRLSRMSQDRLNALKANDEEAYLKLLDQSKDTRITHLLSQTNSFLKTLTNGLEKQKATAGDVARTDDDDEPRDYYETAHKVKELVHEQPSILVGGTLKDYQVKGLQWMVSLYNNRLNGILADEMGLGKTIQTLSLITYLIEKKKQAGPFLVIVPLSTMTNWVNEFEKWAPSVLKIVYKGSPNERRMLSAQVRQGNYNVLLTTYEYIINPKDRPTLCRIKWVHIIIDEGHRLKNANSRLSITLMQYYSARYRLILTGTPLQNNLPELWALLNFILPKIFNSVKSFDEWFNTPFATATGQERIDLNEEEQLLIIRRLHKVLRPFLLRRLKKDVESELPDKVETIIKCPLSSLQSKLYEQIRSRRMGEGFQKKKALNNLVMQFRKVCNHPYVFEQVEEAINPMKVTDMNLVRVCGKFELLDRILPKMKVTGHRILMFFQMTQIMDIMEDYLRYKSFSYLRLDGNTKADDRTMMLNTFNSKADPPFIFLLSTRAGGLGLNLQTADTVIIYDSDWNPHQDLQAQDRAHRIGQKKEVRILRLITSKSVEEAILARAQYKLDLDGKVIQAGKFDQKTTDREREDLLRTLLGGESDSEEEKEREGEMEDGELNEIIARDEEELVLFNKMDAERRMQEEQDHVARGGTLPYHRLIQESELPPIFIQSEVAPVAPVEYTGRGARQRKEIVYEDPAAEDMFAETTENDVKDFMVREKRKQEQLKEAISDDEEGIDLVDPTFDPVEGIGADIMRIYKAVVDVVDHSDGYPRQRCELYMDLPDRQLYEDYYSLIANPISLHVIKKKIQHNGYANLEEAKTDFMTLCQNAKEYNTPESQVYQDAIVLQQVFEEVYRKRKQVDQETVDNDNAARKRMKIEDDDLESFEAVSEAVDSEIVDGSSLY